MLRKYTIYTALYINTIKLIHFNWGVKTPAALAQLSVGHHNIECSLLLRHKQDSRLFLEYDVSWPEFCWWRKLINFGVLTLVYQGVEPARVESVAKNDC